MKNYIALFAYFLWSISMIAQINSDPNLIARYPFDGNGNDISTNGFNATLVGPSDFVPDRNGNPNSAFAFNGISNYFLVNTVNPTFKPNTFPISISCWVIIPSNFQGQFTFFKNDYAQNIYSGIRGTVIPSGQVTISLENGGPIGAGSRRTKSGTTNIKDNNWHLITCIVRGFNDMDIFIDCSNDGGTYSGGATTLAYSPSNPGIIGAYDGVLGNNNFEYSLGSIDDLLFLSRELSTDEIASIYGMLPVEIIGDTLLCPGTSVNLTAEGGDSYLWSTGETSQTIEVSIPGNYSVEVTDANGCALNREIEVYGPPVASWTPTVLCESDGEFDLNNLVNGTLGGTWSGSGVNEHFFNPTGLSGQITINYSVGNSNCIDSQTNFLQVITNPDPPIVLSDTIYCEGSPPPELVAITATVSEFEWIQSTNPDIVLSTENNFFPPQNISGQFGARHFVDGCPSEYSMVEVEVIPMPEAPIFNENVVLCAENLSESIIIQSAGSLMWFSDSGLSNLINEGSVYPAGILAEDITEMYIVSIENNCASTILEIPITREDTLEAHILGNEVVNVCFPGEITLHSSETFANFWSNGETSQSISVNSAGLYTLTRSNSCNTAIDTVQVVDVSVDATFDLIIPSDTYLPVTIQVSNYANGCDWFLQGEPLILDEYGRFTITEETDYLIEHQCENYLGCADTQNRTFSIKSPSEFYVPNAFTPNGDGVNDVFIPKGFKIEKLELLIFNRWGELIFETNDMNKGWNGKTKFNRIAPDGLYTYFITAIDVYQNKYEYIGSVHLFQ